MLLGSGGYTKAFAGTEQNTESANNTASIVDADTYESGANAATTSVPAGTRTYFPAQFLDFDMNKINYIINKIEVYLLFCYDCIIFVS